MKSSERPSPAFLAADLSAPENAGKKQFYAILLGIFLMLVVLAMLSALVWYGHRRLYLHNNAFVIQKIDIITDGNEQTRSMVEAALDSMAITKGKSRLPEIDLLQLRTQLARSPYLEEVEIRRHFPDTLAITVKAAIPAVVLDFRREDVRLKLDQFGIVRPYDLNTGSKFLPRLVGPGLGNSGEYVPGQPTTNEGLLLFLRFLREINRLPDGALFEVDQCSIDLVHGTLTMYFGEAAHPPFRNGTQMVLPFKDFDAKFTEVRNVVNAHLRSTHKRPIGKLDARFDKLYVSY